MGHSSRFANIQRVECLVLFIKTSVGIVLREDRIVLCVAASMGLGRRVSTGPLGFFLMYVVNS